MVRIWNGETIPRAREVDGVGAICRLSMQVLQIRTGEDVVLYADTVTDPRVVQATSEAAHTIGAKVTTVWYETKGDIDLPPPEPIEAAVLAADMVIEFAVAYLVHSAMWHKARRAALSLNSFND